MTGAFLSALVLAAALIGAAAAIFRANRRESLARAAVLADCASVLDQAQRSVAPSGYGVLRGAFDCRAAALTPIAEALAFRRLPQLWLSVAVGDADEARPSIEIIRRATGTEPFSGGAALPFSLRPPASWPKDANVRASRGAGPALAALEHLLARAFADDKIKAVMIGPRGVRVIMHAAQGERGAYLLFRDAHFPTRRIQFDEARAGLALASSIADRLRRHERAEILAA